MSFRKAAAYCFPFVYSLLDKNKKIIKFAIAGTVAAIADLGLLYFLTDFAGFWYIYSAALSCLLAFFISFILQKFWTFRDNSRSRFPQQFFSYFLLNVISIFLNLFFLFILVEKAGFYYVLAQIFSGGVLALFRFLVNNFIIFKKIHYEI